MTDASKPFVEFFDNEDHAAQYPEGPSKFMPGFRSVHQMAGVLIRETAPAHAQVLVHGAGGGLEIAAFASANPDWTFVGVDPAKAMLDQAEARLAGFSDRVSLHHGFAEDARPGPFDAATSFLTLHFLDAEERLKAVSEIVQRLKPGAPFVTAYCSIPQTKDQKTLWLNRHAAYTVASGVDPEVAEKGGQDIAEHLFVFDPEVDQQILESAGLKDVGMFYSAFTWRGWVGHAG